MTVKWGYEEHILARFILSGRSWKASLKKASLGQSEGWIKFLGWKRREEHLRWEQCEIFRYLAIYHIWDCIWFYWENWTKYVACANNMPIYLLRLWRFFGGCWCWSWKSGVHILIKHGTRVINILQKSQELKSEAVCQLLKNLTVCESKYIWNMTFWIQIFLDRHL